MVICEQTKRGGGEMVIPERRGDGGLRVGGRGQLAGMWSSPRSHSETEHRGTFLLCSTLKHYVRNVFKICPERKKCMGPGQEDTKDTRPSCLTAFCSETSHHFYCSRRL